MKQTIKITMLMSVVALVFGVFNIISPVQSEGGLFAPHQAFALGTSGCGSCGGGSTGSGSTFGGGGGSDHSSPIIPSCVISATPTTIVTGNSSVLKWTTSNAISASLNQSIGTVAVGSNVTRSVSPTGTLTYTMTVHSSDGHTATCATVVTVTVPAPVPTCTLTADPTSIVSGGTSKLMWTSVNAVSGSIDQGVGGVNPNNTAGFRNVSPTATKTYTLTVQNTDGVSATCNATVSVTPVTVPAPICTLTPSPASIVSGNSSQLTWTSTNAVSGSIDQGIGTISIASIIGQSVSPTVTKTYTMTVANSAGVTATCNAVVTVTTPDAPACEYFRATPATINRGDSTNLSWATVRATSASINNGIGNVAVSNTSYSVSPLESTTYTLTLNGTGGSTQCTVPVTVIQPHSDNLSCSQNVHFYADNTFIARGNHTTLHWDTTNVSNVSITDLGSQSVDGSATVSPTASRIYTLTASNGSDSISCPLNIDVTTSHGGGGGSGTTRPQCDLSISDSSITLGERVALKWNSRYANDVKIEDTFGKVLVTTDGHSSSEKKDLFDSEMTIRPERDTTYTMVASRGSLEDTCDVKVSVGNAVVVSQIRQQLPVVSGIALTQVPYTGFEAGPVMTFFFFGLLALWALYLAYVLVVRRNGEMGGYSFATSGAVMSDTTVTAHNYAMPEVKATPVFHQPVTAAAVAAASTATVGYAVEDKDELASMIENHAHTAKVLLSSDARVAFVSATTHAADRTIALDAILAAAKASYPTEDGWVVLGEERMNTLLATQLAA